MTTAGVFRVPNYQDAGTGDQKARAVLDEGHLAILADGAAGKGVVSGCAVSVNSGTVGAANTLQVAVGEAIADGRRVTVAADTTVAIATAHSTNPRRDLVVFDLGSGAVEVKTGTAEDYVPGTSAPQLPLPDADQVALAVVYVGPAAATITSADLSDVRMVVRPGRWFDATDYAAQGLGDGDDWTTAIQAANDAAAANPGGGMVRLPPWTLVISSDVVIDEDVIWVGQGQGATRIQKADGSSARLISRGYDARIVDGLSGDDAPQGLGLRDLSFDGNKWGGATGDGVCLYAAHFYIENVSIRQCAGWNLRTRWDDTGGGNAFGPYGYDHLTTNKGRPLEARIRFLSLWDGDEGNWFYEGPHDTICTDLVSVGQRTTQDRTEKSGIRLGGTHGSALQADRWHCWGTDYQHHIEILTGANRFTNIVSEGAWRNQIRVNTSGAVIMTGIHVFGQNNLSYSIPGQLNEALDASETGVDVDPDAQVRYRVGEVIQIGSERMQITAIPSTTTLTVTRGFGGTTPASHSNGAAVIHEVKQVGIEIAGGCNGSVIQGRFGAGNDGLTGGAVNFIAGHSNVIDLNGGLADAAGSVLYQGTPDARNRVFLGAEKDDTGYYRVNGPDTPLAFYGGTPAAKPTLTGSRAGNAALGSLTSALSTLGLATDSTTAGTVPGGRTEFTGDATGATDVRAALETFLNAGGHLYIGPGSYRIDTQANWTQTAPTDLLIHPDARIFGGNGGAGFGTTTLNGCLIEHTTSGSAAKYLRIEGGQLDAHDLPNSTVAWPFDANAAAEWPPVNGTGLDNEANAFSSRDADLDRMEIIGVTFWMDGPTPAGTDWHWTNGGGDSACFVDLENIRAFRFLECQVYGSRDAGLYVAAVGANPGPKHMEVAHSYFHGCGGGGVDVKGHIVGGHVHHNSFWNCAEVISAVDGNDGSAIGVLFDSNVVNGYWHGFNAGSTTGRNVLRNNVWINAGHFDAEGVSMSDSGGPLDDFFDTPVVYWMGVAGGSTIDVRDDVILNGEADGSAYNAIGTWGGFKPWVAYFGDVSGNRLHNVRVPGGSVFDRLANEFGTASDNVISWDDPTMMDHTLDWTNQSDTSRATGPVTVTIEPESGHSVTGYVGDLVLATLSRASIATLGSTETLFRWAGRDTAWYEFEFWIDGDVTAVGSGGHRFGFNTPGTTVDGHWDYDGPTNSSDAAGATQANYVTRNTPDTASVVLGGASTTRQVTKITGTIKPAADGDIDFRWAQRLSSAEACRIYPGSRARVRRVK